MVDTATSSAVPARQDPADRTLSIVGSPMVVSIVVALVIGGAIIAASGNSPVASFQAMVKGAFAGSGLRNTLARTVPIAGMAFVFAIPLRAGVINLGGEGQMLFGGLAGALVAIYAPGPAWLVLVLAIAAGMAVGAVWAFVPAIGQSKMMLPILITSLLLNYIARSITGYLVRFQFGDPTATAIATVGVPLDHRLPVLPIAGGVTISLVFLLALTAAIAVYNRRTVGGYESIMTGMNPRFARYGGVGVDRQRTRLMLVAGAIAGAVGAHIIVGQLFVYIDGDLAGTAFAWSGLMVALLAPRKPFGILLAAFMFAALQVGGLAMQRTTDVSWQLAQVLQGIVIITFISGFAITWRRKRPVLTGSLPDDSAADELEADA